MASPFARFGIRALGATVLLTIAGCGGKGSETDTATVIPDPTARVSSPAATAPAATTTSAPASTSTSGNTTAPVKTEGWGTLKGRVVFDGDAPAMKVLVAKGDTKVKNPEVCSVTEIKSERLVVDPASKGVKNVIVYLTKPTAVNPEAKSAKTSASVIFDQKNCVFEPHVLAVMVGAKIDLKSSDAAGHNVNSKVQNNAFNEAVAPKGEIFKVPVAAARQPGIVVCDIHDWMKAYWLVLDHPYFAVTDDKGNFEIKNAPAGTQKVVVWQEATQFLNGPMGQNVNIAPNGETTQEFKIATSQIKPEQ